MLTGERGADAPVAAALVDTVERFRLPREKLISLIDARLFDLYDAPMLSVAGLESYAAATAGSLFQLAAFILDPAVDAAAASRHAGIAYAVTGLLRGLPWQTAAGQTYVPHELYAGHDLDNRPGLDVALAKLRALARQHLDGLGRRACRQSGEGRARVSPHCALRTLSEADGKAGLRSARDPRRSFAMAAPMAALARGQQNRLKSRPVSPLAGMV